MADAKPATSPEDILVGGQAVIEGVMMRTPHAYAVAVRRMDGSIEVKRELVKRLSERWKVFSWWVVRGFAVLVQSMALGIKTLNYSINVSVEDLEAKEAAEAAAKEAQGEAGATTGASAKKRKKKQGGGKSSGNAAPIALSMLLGVVAAVALFILLPLGLTHWLKSYYPAIENWIVFNLVDGGIRVIVFFAYLLAISRLKDIRRVFEYHGAEHKVVHTWEDGVELTVENARQRSTLHPRCGTSFLMFVMVVSILVFSIFKFHAFWAIFLSRVVLIPVVSGLSYELIRFSASRCKKGFFRLLVLPGLGLQRITTKAPSDDQLEVAIRALTESLELDGVKLREEAPAPAA
ncbi:MAG: DUF1385 domain-containing protein [Acidobacteriota bacterium]|jgi:uncharacterized protein YqhQ|nr:DUF1385 domain-containing protein [Acidobacteriota bacterium]